MLRIEEHPFGLDTSPFMAMEAPREVTAAEVTDTVLEGAWVVDVRVRRSVAAGPSSTVGCLVPVEDGFVLLTDSPTDHDPSRYELAG